MIDAMNATPPMQSNQSSVNLYETINAVQMNATRRLLYIILTKNQETDFTTFGSTAEISVARYRSNVSGYTFKFDGTIFEYDSS